MKNLVLVLAAIGMLSLFNSCNKESLTPADNPTIETRKFEPPCKGRITTDYEGLADIGGGFNPEWYGGELDRLLRHCVVGLQPACESLIGFEYEEFCCEIIFNYDTNGDGLFDPTEQDAMIDFIMLQVDNFQPSCSNATLIAIDVFRDALAGGAFGFSAKYMCCAGASKD